MIYMIVYVFVTLRGNHLSSTTCLTHANTNHFKQHSIVATCSDFRLIRFTEIERERDILYVQAYYHIYLSLYFSLSLYIYIYINTYIYICIYIYMYIYRERERERDMYREREREREINNTTYNCLLHHFMLY